MTVKCACNKTKPIDVFVWHYCFVLCLNIKTRGYAVCLFVCLFVALRPKSTAMVIAGWSVHLTTLFPGQA